MATHPPGDTVDVVGIEAGDHGYLGKQHYSKVKANIKAKLS